MISMNVSTAHGSNCEVGLNETGDMLTIDSRVNLSPVCGEPVPYEIVTVHIHGTPEDLREFARRIQAALPPLVEAAGAAVGAEAAVDA